MRVEFLIAGTQKGGTTALDEFLRAHPALSLARKKEVHFFDDETVFASGRPDPEAYHRNFDQGRTGTVYGESTPVYMYWEPAAARIRAYNPLMKLIFLLRNPVERSFAGWQMEKNRRGDELSFGEAIRRERARSAAASPLQHRVYSYTDRGFYSRQIKHILEFFHREQMLFLKTEELRTHHDATIARVHRFLGVGAVPAPPARLVFSSRPYGAMDEADREYLLALYEEEFDELEQLLGWDCSDWRT